ncbi:type II toxin-antitoxin system RelE/ParE family toxin [Candidatus Poribacteria bacterium]|nr:type II toxin-antitoxin system RelE/ParE family toxin [Candidatus Poribacteria bacterium]MYB65219.1 type II toxin-antitoxin system RelE/ParE family toxin [Candidatus Poribacteria bacterium]MYF55325.1 type II toxin-antitoxin system RelE/ParE family toxin [Candidatus Poribacteria bacterium]MYI94981.1 type II toxin-antitoxin system RelE/ParE family toxin [Candidatus Poribacteria bacterium]
MNTQTTYTVRATRRAEQELRRLPQNVIRRIDAVLEQLQQNPRPSGVMKLTGQNGSHWRIRVGAYRILYQIDDLHRRVNIYRIKHRRNAYR